MSHRHTITWTVGKKNKVTITPQIVNKGDDIQIDTSAAKAPIAVFFPDKSLTGKHQYLLQPGVATPIKIKAQRDQWTVFTYAAYFEEYHEFAEGSSPIIIVRP